MSYSQVPIKDIAVIIVNYRLAESSINAVESALASDLGGRRLTVHLVDNASPGDDAAVLSAAWRERSWGPTVTLHLENYNHGFGRGNNVVLHKLVALSEPPDAVFLLNPDATVRPDALRLLAAALEGEPCAAVAGCRTENPSGAPLSAAFRFPSLASEFSRAVCFGPISRLFARAEVPLSPDHPGGFVDWVAGAAMMARLPALAEVNFFDPAYFLYHEEVDLMLRLRRRGWRVLYVPQAGAVHMEGASTGVRTSDGVRRRRPGYWYDSWRIYFTHNHGRTYALACALVVCLGAILNQVISSARMRPPARPINFFGDFWRHVVRPLLPPNAADRPETSR
jgi:GT2 family glycosyltransferase